jgi:small-conductance mechanosensitive channel
METLYYYWSELARFNITLVNLGDVELTVTGVLKLLVLLWLLIYFTRRLTRFVDWRIGLIKPHFDPGTRLAIVSIIRYALLIIGTMVVLQTFGIKLTAFAVLAGAIGVGVGFGLQQIISNFISGLIIMFERPIKVGDRIELGNLEGNVAEIGMRRTTIVTNDNIAILVPNSRFITDNVVNLRYHADHIRVRVSINVLQGADPKVVERLLLEVAASHPDVLKEPPPAVRLLALQGGGNMGFELQVWNTTRVNARDALVSELNFAVREKLQANEIKLA